MAESLCADELVFAPLGAGKRENRGLVANDDFATFGVLHRFGVPKKAVQSTIRTMGGLAAHFLEHRKSSNRRPEAKEPCPVRLRERDLLALRKLSLIHI